MASKPIAKRPDLGHADEVHPLTLVANLVLRQATQGKGQRHGGGVTPFYQQQWVNKAQIHGNGFLTGQAGKKLDEAVVKVQQLVRDGHEAEHALTTETHEAWERELLGAIVYLSMAILHRRGLPTEPLADVP